MPFAEALKRAGSFEALLPHLREGRILARCNGIYSWPSGRAESTARDIRPEWWAKARIDPATGRVILTVPGSRIISPGQALPPRRFREVFAIGIELEATAVETLFPVATVSAPRHPGGRDADHNWEDAARHLDSWVAAHGPLRRHKNGNPIVARAVALMTEWFKKNDPPAPRERSIRRWIHKKPRSWWGPN